MCVCVCVCVFEKSVGFATVLFLFLLSQIRHFVFSYICCLLFWLAPNSPLRDLQLFVVASFASSSSSSRFFSSAALRSLATRNCAQ